MDVKKSMHMLNEKGMKKLCNYLQKSISIIFLKGILV